MFQRRAWVALTATLAAGTRAQEMRLRACSMTPAAALAARLCLRRVGNSQGEEGRLEFSQAAATRIRLAV